MKTRGEGKEATAGAGKTGGRLHLLERFVHAERLEMSHEWVVKLGNKNGAQIDLRTCPTKQEAENVVAFVRGIVAEILEAEKPTSMNGLLVAGICNEPMTQKEREAGWQRP